MIRTSDYIVSVSKAGIESFQAFDKKLMDRKVTAIVYNGIDEDLLKSGQAQEWKWDSSDIRLPYIGRIEEIKGVQNLSKAVERKPPTLSTDTHGLCPPNIHEKQVVLK